MATVAGIFVGCVDDEFCVGVGTNMMEVKFIESGSDPEAAKSITFDSIWVSGSPENYSSYADTTASDLLLSIDPDTAWTRFVFFADSTADTLDLDYIIIPRLISPTCGPENVFSGLNTSYHTFDSVAVVNELLSRDVDSNLKIYN